MRAWSKVYNLLPIVSENIPDELLKILNEVGHTANGGFHRHFKWTLRFGSVCTRLQEKIALHGEITASYVSVFKLVGV